MDELTKQQHYIRHLEHDIWAAHTHLWLILEDHREKRSLGMLLKTKARRFDQLADEYLAAFAELERLAKDVV